MKRLLSLFIALTLTVITFGTNFLGNITNTYADTTTNTWPAAPSIYAKAGVLIDANSGTVIYDKKANKKMYPASITKIMTALLTIENCKLDDIVTYSSCAVNLELGAANIACQAGEKMKVKDCLYALMLASANESATALGEHIGGSVDKFAEMMTARAKQAGALNTHFTNCNGLHDKNHYVTAYDMAMITKDALKYPLFREIVNTTNYTIPKDNKKKETQQIVQRHKMVFPTHPRYYEGIIGGKTGLTTEAGNTLVTCVQKNGMTLIAVVLHTDYNHVYEDTTKLLDYGFNNFKPVNVSQNDTRFSSSDTTSLKSPFSKNSDSISIDSSSNVIIPKNVAFSKLTSYVNFTSSKDSFATLTYKYANNIVGSAKISYKTDNSFETSTTQAAKTTQVSETTKVTSSSDLGSTPKSEDVTIASSTGTSKSKNLFTRILPITITVIIVVLIICVIVLQKRKMNKIREMKRTRKR